MSWAVINEDGGGGILDVFGVAGVVGEGDGGCASVVVQRAVGSPLAQGGKVGHVNREGVGGGGNRTALVIQHGDGLEGGSLRDGDGRNVLQRAFVRFSAVQCVVNHRIGLFACDGDGLRGVIDACIHREGGTWHTRC